MNSSLITSHGNPSSEPKRPRIRLDYLDGLRGFAALYVVFHHAYIELVYRTQGAGIPGPLLKGLKFLDFGHYAVDVFIVLSGYCLMLPVSRSVDSHLPNGLYQYLVRRATRILPPYYAALVCALGLCFVIHNLTLAAGMDDHGWLQSYSPGVLLSHLLVVHNLRPNWATAIDPPMWSVATEWQIYFLFPLLLLPFWRRFGNIGMVAVAFATGLAPHYLLRGRFDQAAPWFIGLFALGASAALINFSNTPRMMWWRDHAPWGCLTGASWLALALFGILRGGWYKEHRWFADPMFGFATACLLIYCTNTLHNNADHSLVVKALSSRTAALLGAFSYSLYLIHYPLLSIGHLILFQLKVSPLLRAGAMMLVVAPTAVAIAFFFHIIFERPFMRGLQSRA